MSKSVFFTIEQLAPGTGVYRRDRSVDLLCCLAAFMVCLLDAAWLSTPHWYGLLEPGAPGWMGGTLCRILCGSPAMLIAMISGICLLAPERELTIGDVLKKAAGLACGYIFWCFIYALYRILQMEPQPLLTPGFFLQQWIAEPEPLWFITVLTGLYIITPILRYITATRDGKLMRYIVLVFTGAVVLLTILKWPGLPIGEEYLIPELFTSPVQLFCQYMFWMLFGWIAYNYRPSGGLRIAVCVLAAALVIAAVFTGAGDLQYAADLQEAAVTGRLSIVTLAKNMAIFYLIIDVFGDAFSAKAGGSHTDTGGYGAPDADPPEGTEVRGDAFSAKAGGSRTDTGGHGAPDADIEEFIYSHGPADTEMAVYEEKDEPAGGGLLKVMAESTMIIYLSHWLFLLFLFDHGFLQNGGMGVWAVILIYAVISWACGLVIGVISWPVRQSIKRGFH